MSIDARIAAVTVVSPSHCDTCKGTGKDPENNWDWCPTCHGATEEVPAVRLHLEPRELGGCAGQPVLTIVNPPSTDLGFWPGLVGTEIWGGAGEIMVGEKVWAKRVGYTRIELVDSTPPPGS